MSQPQKVGFVSLGCPKALVDSERILTQLRFDGYEVSPSYTDAGVVIVNTCGFIDSAKEESLAAIGEALEENGRVLVTGCMGGGEQANLVLERHPKVLGITGPAAYEEVLSEVRRVLPNPHKPDPKLDLIPAQGVKLTPRHYAYLKISEGCNHRCRFCIIPSHEATWSAARLAMSCEKLSNSRDLASGSFWSSHKTPVPMASTLNTEPTFGMDAR